MKLFSKKSRAQQAGVQTAVKGTVGVHPFTSLDRYSPKSYAELELYSTLREAVPVIDAAVCKLVRLVGGFELKAEDMRFQKPLEQFAQSVRVGAGGVSLNCFVNRYLDQLLTYGCAIGEIVPKSDMRGIEALYNASLEDVAIVSGDNPLETLVCRRDINNTVLQNQGLILSSLLNPEAGSVQGNSLLKGLPFVSSILLKILGCMGNNFDRAGNIRYAVTYKPSDSSGVNARHRAEEIAREWSRAMRDDSRVCDFVAVGDVSVKVIGGDAQILDYDIPMRHILEQIVSKLCIPPFLLGLSWSSTERMSTVQADILTSELEYFRTLLTPVIRQIAQTQLRFLGSDCGVEVIWNNISLQDETELANARLMNARAQEIENALEVTH
ncbi:MAG: serine/threonine protein phosphatase [Ruminococcus sp.]|nr:serine/threonine protein phosphatase [Ruminococcus sp.]